METHIMSIVKHNVAFLYPCNPLNKRIVDETYHQEYTLAQNQGLHVHIFDSDNILSSVVTPAIVDLSAEKYHHIPVTLKTGTA
jgi:hypothetical protein